MTTACKAHRPRKIIHLQALRGIAASAVVVDHAIEYPIRRGLLYKEYYTLAWSLGWLGVATFFVISGLIMVRSAADEFGSVSRALRFAKRRLIRVIPLYWLATFLFTAAACAQGQSVTVEMILKSLFFVPYFSPYQHAMHPIVGQGWTLNFEMLFYAIFAISLVLPPKIGLPILMLFFPTLVFVHLLASPIVPYTDPVSLYQFWMDPISLLFVLGLLIGLAESHARHWHRIGYPVILSMLLFFSTIIIFLEAHGRFPLPIGWQALFGLSGGIAVLLCSSARGHRYEQVGRVFEATGDASYSTYLAHPLVLMFMVAIWDRLHLPSPALFVLLAVIACNICGYAIYVSVERPLTLALRKRFETSALPFEGTGDS